MTADPLPLLVAVASAALAAALLVRPLRPLGRSTPGMAASGPVVPPGGTAGGPPGDPPAGPHGAGPGTPRDGAATARVLATAGAALLPAVLLGGWAVLAAPPLAVLAWRAWGSRPDRSRQRRRSRVEAALPQVVDLLAATIGAGAAPEVALVRVADAVPDEVGADLRRAAAGLRLGMPPARVWGELAGAGYGPLGRAMARTVETGAPVVPALGQLAAELRAASRTRAEARARAVGVRAAAPLGVCLLPAFVLVGVVPLVVGLSGLVVGP